MTGIPSSMARTTVSRAVLIIGLLFQGAAIAGDCWLDIYAETGFKGEHQRIDGPAQLANLRALAGQDWSNRIDSLAVGPKAMVRAYRKENFQDNAITSPNHPDALKAWGEKAGNADDEVSFGAGQKHHHLGELNFHHNINSLKIECAP